MSAKTMIDPRLLRTFRTVCEQGSMGNAARSLGIAQPSVSVAIRQLERSLGADLLVRGKKGVALTAAGTALLERAERMHNLLLDAERAVARAAVNAGGPLRIGGTPGALVTLLPTAVNVIGADLPLDIEIIERSDEQLTWMLRRGEIDMAIVTTGVEPCPADLVERSIARDPFALVVGKAHDGLGPSAELAALVACKWVLPRAQGGFHRQIQALFLANGTPLPTDVIRSDSLLVSKEIVRQSDRITLLPRGVVAAELRVGALRAIPIGGAEVSRQVGSRVLKAAPLSTLAARFHDTLVDLHSGTL